MNEEGEGKGGGLPEKKTISQNESIIFDSHRRQVLAERLRAALEHLP